MNYRFVINGQASEAYDEEAIRKLIDLRVIGVDTPAWCEGMEAWKPAGQIGELATILGVEVKAAPSSPPPIPGQTPQTQNFQAAAPSSCSKPPVTGSEAPADGFQSIAKRFIYWWCRPWNGRRSIVRDHIDRNPSHTLPVAAGLAVLLFLCCCMIVSPFVAEREGSSQPASNQVTDWGGQGMPQGMPGGGFNMENWRIMRGAQQQTAQMSADAFKEKSDSFNRQSETYRRANYDWYNPGND